MGIPVHEAADAASPGVACAGRGVSVLMVDMPPDVAAGLQRGLRGEHLFVEFAHSLDTAGRLRERYRFDLVVANYDALGQPLADWVCRLRVDGDPTPVIFVADNLDADLAVTALRAGASDIVSADAGSGDFPSALRRVLKREKAPHLEDASAPKNSEVFGGDGIVGESSAMTSLCDVIKRVAPMPTTVLIEGESGTGKELVAQAMHRLSGRRGNFAAINCGAITAELFESELFGHVKGAFTGALQARDGLFSYARGGTVFLDEIAEMPLAMQAKLLRVLEQRTIRPVGSNREVAVDVRMIAATNHDLAATVAEGLFREDLYHRLNVISLEVPPLRERPEDIPALGRYFVEGFSSRMGVPAPHVGEVEWLRLSQYAWPGNVRELRNVIERCVLLNRRPSALLDGATAQEAADDEQDDLSLESVERRHIMAVLDLCNGNKSESARRLGISRKTLERKVRRWEEETR